MNDDIIASIHVTLQEEVKRSGGIKASFMGRNPPSKEIYVMIPDQQRDIEVRGYLTAFVDLLGFSNRLLDMEKIPHFQENVIPEDFEKEVGGTVRAAEWLRDGFSTFYQACSDPSTRQPPAPLEPEQIEVGNRRFPDPPSIQWFSDCILVSVPIKPEWPVSFYRSLRSLIIACAITQLRAVALKIPARGGISLGYGARLNTGEILGAGLAKAYQLESKEALYPRILIDPELVDIARPPSKSPPDWKEKEFEIVQSSWKEIMEFLRRDRDGYWFVDFFNDDILKLVNDQEGKMVGAVLRLIDEAMAPYMGSDIYPRNATPSDRNRFAKWMWLANYWKENREHVVNLLPKMDNQEG